MFNEKIVKKIDKHLHKHFKELFEFKFDGLLLFYGQTLRALIQGDKGACNYSFVLLTQTEENVIDFINKYKLEYTKDFDNEYEIKIAGLVIEIKVLNDLCYVGNLSTDFLFYDIEKQQFIPIGIKQALTKNEIVDYGYVDGIYDREKVVEAKRFVNFLNKNNKRVKLKRKNKKSKLLNWLCRW